MIYFPRCPALIPTKTYFTMGGLCDGTKKRGAATGRRGSDTTTCVPSHQIPKGGYHRWSDTFPWAGPGTLTTLRQASRSLAI